ncbi:MAG: hypothetical protein J0L94_09755 [Rhodothermia bacterium]|nr:hypothetical protein [Rhodothermia bacterium]
MQIGRKQSTLWVLVLLVFASTIIGWWLRSDQKAIEVVQDALSQYVLTQKTGESAYFQDRITFFEHQKKPCRVALLGDSLTDIGDWVEMGSDLGVVNRGISGDTIAGLKSRLKQSLACKPKKVVVLIGINDLIAGASPEQVVRQLKELLLSLKSLDRTLVWQTLLPIHSEKFIRDTSFGAAFNQQIKQVNHNLKTFCAIHKIETVDVYQALSDESGQLQTGFTHDGLHLNGIGYKVWFTVLQPYMR